MFLTEKFDWLYLHDCSRDILCNWLIQYQLCIIDVENQTLSPASKHFLEWHFRFGHHNLHETHLIIWSPPFGTDKFLSSSCIPFENFPKCEVCKYEKAKRKALHGKKTHIYVSHEGPLCNNNPPHGFGVSVDNFVPHWKGVPIPSLVLELMNNV